MWILIQTQLLSEVLQRQLGFIITEKKQGCFFGTQKGIKCQLI